MRIAMVQLDTAWEDPPANREAVRASVPDADVAVLPELTFSGFTMAPRPDPEAEPFLRDLARRRSLHLIAGYAGEGPRNVAVAVSPEGDVLARYAKLHPFSYAGEHLHYVAGDDLPLFRIGGLRAAVLICYDLRFPEVFREAALRGAGLFFVLANWPERRQDHWRTLLRARAIENQAFVVGVNRVGEDPNERYAGGSLAVDPLGEVLAEGDAVAEIDPGTVAWLRDRFPALGDARTDRYGLLPD